eukprot:TRINITY_DN20501_c0_g1_i1.p1 TRINITY_DN20501_c0_g1~~TRINITY_DN20501_c0_g1_i1.p1  ORF type:complete len:409 (-),score=68.36 TRINITY_DN20501_c0_g1_i1:131-1357(-)
MASCAALRLCLRTTGHSLELSAAVGKPEDVDEEALRRTAGPLEYELYVDGNFVASKLASDLEATERGHTVSFSDLGEGEKNLELWLPTCVPLDVYRISCGGEAAEPLKDDLRPVWLCYGSSITHGGPSAASPSCTWPAVSARACNLRLMNMGFGGECFLDQAVARAIRDAACDCLVLKVGINIQTMSALTARTFQPALLGFIQTVRDGHSKTPIMVVSPIWYGPLEEKAPLGMPGFMSLQEVRKSICQAVSTLQNLGDCNVFYRDGLDLLGKSDAHLLYDDLHPGPEGNIIMGHRFAEFEFGDRGRLLSGRFSSQQRPSYSLPEVVNEKLQGGYLVDMPGENRSGIMLQLREGKLVAFSQRSDWPPQLVHVRTPFVFLPRCPGVWGKVDGQSISFSNGATWTRFGLTK